MPTQGDLLAAVSTDVKEILQLLPVVAEKVDRVEALTGDHEDRIRVLEKGMVRLLTLAGAMGGVVGTAIMSAIKAMGG